MHSYSKSSHKKIAITHQFIHLKKSNCKSEWSVSLWHYFSILIGHLHFFQMLFHVLHPIFYFLNYWFWRIVSIFLLYVLQKLFPVLPYYSIYVVSLTRRINFISPNQASSLLPYHIEVSHIKLKRQVNEYTYKDLFR